MRPDKPRFTIATANRAFLAATHTKSEDIIGQSFFEAFPANSTDDSRLQTFQHALDQVMEQKSAQVMRQHRYDLPHTDEAAGRARYWDIEMYPLLDSQGEVQYIVQSSVDITSLVEAEKKVKDSNERYEYINKATNDAIYDWDLESNHIHWGDAFFRLFGYEENTYFPIERWAKLVHPEDVLSVTDSLNQTLADTHKSSWAASYRIRRLNDTYAFVEENGYILRDKHGRAVRMIGVIKDVTERVEVSWTQAHLLRAPLARILGLIQLLDDPGDRESTRQVLNYLRTSATDLDCIVRELINKSQHRLKNG